MDKLITVVIPTYNRQELTDKAVNSVVTRAPSFVEILVVDDCGSQPYMHDTFNASGVSVNIIRLNQNVGAGMARHTGVAQASGRFIAFLDSDDSYDTKWIENIVDAIQSIPESHSRLIVFSGVTQGGRSIARLTRYLLTMIPQSLQLTAARLVATLFNPFYTPSLVLSKELCVFMPGMRHCEDYYSTAFALFSAEALHLPPATACHLGRAPNSFGGESSATRRMYLGEWQVRIALWKNTDIPFTYKLLVPVGMIYQWLRSSIKRAIKMATKQSH